MELPFLPYAAPPIIGAFIGYLTNKIAIRMLFRPLRKWRVAGIPVPMTPGVIPAKRHALARNFGEIVGSHLLTSKDIGAALSEERFQDHLRVRVDEVVKELLARELGPLPSLVPERFQPYMKVAVRTAKYQARLAVHRYVQSDEFQTKVTRAVVEQLQVLADRPLNALVTREERQAAYTFIDTLVGDLLAGEQSSDWLAAHLRENLQSAIDEGRTVADYLPLPLQELLLSATEKHSPAILRQLGRIVAEPPVRERIIGAVRGAVNGFIANLGPLGAMASSFLDMKRLEDTFREYLSGKEGEIRSWLENEEVQQHFGALLVEQVTKLLQTPVARLLAEVEEDQLAEVCREVALQVLALLRTPGVLASLSALLRESLEEMLGQGDRQIGEVGGQILGSDTARSFKDMVSGETVALLGSQRAAKLIDKVISSMFDQVQRRPVGVLNNLLPSGVRSGLTDYAVLTINRILLREVPSIVDSLNIRQIVTDKIDSLDLMRLERLLLSIMEEQFKYINLFGALLGFLLGLINLLVPALL